MKKNILIGIFLCIGFSAEAMPPKKCGGEDIYALRLQIEDLNSQYLFLKEVIAAFETFGKAAELDQDELFDLKRRVGSKAQDVLWLKAVLVLDILMSYDFDQGENGRIYREEKNQRTFACSPYFDILLDLDNWGQKEKIKKSLIELCLKELNEKLQKLKSDAIDAAVNVRLMNDQYGSSIFEPYGNPMFNKALFDFKGLELLATFIDRLHAKKADLSVSEGKDKGDAQDTELPPLPNIPQLTAAQLRFLER